MSWFKSKEPSVMMVPKQKLYTLTVYRCNPDCTIIQGTGKVYEDVVYWRVDYGGAPNSMAPTAIGAPFMHILKHGLSIYAPGIFHVEAEEQQ